MTISRRQWWGSTVRRALIATVLVALVAPVAAVWNAAPASASASVVDQFGTSSDDFAYDVAVDGSSGAVYVVGESGYTNGFVQAYDSSGAFAWSDAPLGRSVGGVAVDGAGNVYVGGYTESSLDGTPILGGYDAFVRMYDAAGSVQWTWQFGTAADDWVHAVAVDADGSVYVSGGTHGDLDAVNADPEDPDVFVHKYDAAGNVQWAVQQGTADSEYVDDIALDSDGNVYVATEHNYEVGTDYFSEARIDEFASADGSVLASMVYAPEASGVGWIAGLAVDGAGLYVLRTVPTESGTSYGLSQLSLDLADTMWETIGAGSYVDGNALTLDGSGHVYVAGSEVIAGDEGFVRQYTTDGVLQWAQTFGTDSSDWVYGIAFASADAIYAVGATYGAFDGFTNAGSFDGYVAKIAEDPVGTLTITDQPLGAYVRVGDEVTFYADAFSEDSWVVNRQWERNTGGGWEEITGETTYELLFTAAKADDGLYRMRFDHGGDSIYSDEVQLTVSDAAITVSSATVSKGWTTVTFSTSGTPTLTEFQCDLGKGRTPWITCASGTALKGSGKTVTVRGRSASDAPWVYSTAKAVTR